MAEMTPEQQQALAIASARLRLKQSQVGQEQQQSTAMDMLKSAGSGVAQGALDLVGLPGTIQNAFDQGFSKITDDVASLWGGKGVPAPPPSQLSGEQLRKGVSYLTSGATEYKPETTAGEYTQTAASFVPGAVALGGSGNIIGNALKLGVVPGLTSEGAGKLAHEYAPSLEPYARFAGAVAGGLIPAGLRAMVPTVKEAGLAEIAKAAAADNLSPQQMGQKLDNLGPKSMVADLGPNFQGQTGALANLPGKSNETIRTALNERHVGANTRLAQTIDETTGRNIVPSEIQAEIGANQASFDPLYREAFRGARPYNIEPIASALEADISRLRGPAQARLRQVRGMLNIADSNVLSTDPGVMFQTRQAIDGLLKTEVDPKVISALTEARQMLDDGLTRAVPRIKEVDAGYAELARQNEAVTRGQQVLDSGRTAPRPSELAAEVEQGVQPQGMQIGPSAVPLRLSQGARAEIDRIVGTNSNDIAAMNRLIKGEGDWNRQRLSTLFGEEKANRLIQVLDNEKVYAGTRDFALGNSVSANRLQYQRQYGGGSSGMNISDYYGAGGLPGAVRGTAVKLARALFGKAIDARQQAINAETAKNLTGQKAVVDALLQRQLQGNRLAGPAKAALAQALLDQRRRLEGQ
ncbi:hypothetical protein CPT32_13055 [Rhizobium sophoriradicis]|uniref:hypothetical protein n=1 Tax=Rhizobium sophoriradicis TaxID=1535245 RepID=UPI000BBDFA7A|nr:hypothetical protein [Rhizobium sophoriradicis]PCK86341.1 hypothetical protein CPT32_13055 [Rhizobium sophoriradicis]